MVSLSGTKEEEVSLTSAISLEDACRTARETLENAVPPFLSSLSTRVIEPRSPPVPNQRFGASQGRQFTKIFSISRRTSGSASSIWSWNRSVMHSRWSTSASPYASAAMSMWAFSQSFCPGSLTSMCSLASVGGSIEITAKWFDEDPARGIGV